MQKQTQEISEYRSDFIKETYWERLCALADAFPAPVRNFTERAIHYSKIGLKKGFALLRNVTFIAASSSAILFMPVVMEVERAQIAEIQRKQQTQVLFGPGMARSPGLPPVQ